MNKVILIGRLARDPELRTTSSGVSMTRFTVAVNRPIAQGTQPQTDFISCIAWKQTAETISKFLKKGSLIAIEGSIQTRSWESGDGKMNYATDIVVNRMHFVEKKSKDSGTVQYEQEPITKQPSPVLGDDPLMSDMGVLSSIPEEDLPF